MKFFAGSYKQQFNYRSFLPCFINGAEFEFEDKKLLAKVEEAGSYLGKLNGYSQIFPNIDWFIRMHVVKEATTSSLIEGTKTNLDEALLPKTEILPEKKDDWQEVQNYIKAINWAVGQLPRLPLSMRLLNKAHQVLLAGVRGKYKNPGEIRKSQNWIGGNTLANARFIPPHQDDLPDLLADLEKFWHNQEIKLPFLIKAAIAHYQFETIHSYLDGNGRIGRLLITLQLIEQGLLSKPILYLSEFLEKYRVEYFDSLDRVRLNNNPEQWLIFFLNGITATAKKGVLTFDQLIKLQKMCRKKIDCLGRKKKLGQKLLEILFGSPIIKVNKAAKELAVTFPTANDLLKDFVKTGILKEATGFGRNRLFSFAEYISIFKRE
ncbi:Fic family protein [Patescibacteria group bacterium]|nr:Fic family protein [Patescibacteria group bacterium]MBU1499645.1 Fic family protein [Patescibacteria group bacterium]